MNEKSTLFSNINPTNDNWISCGSGHGGISYQFVVTREYIRVELWIIGRSKEDNKEIYDCLYEHRETIEEKFENELDWQRLDEGKGSRVGYTLFDVSVLNKDDWQEMIDFAVTYMIKLEKSVKQKLQNVMRILS